MNNKMKLWLIIPVCAIVLLIGGTYAWYVWQTSSDEETIIATDVGYAKVFFDGGSDVSGKLKPVSDKSKGMSKEIIVNADKEFIEDITFNLYLDINSIDADLKHESFKFELYKDGNLVKAGNFSENYLTSALSECTTNTGVSHITLTSDIVTTEESVYTLYTWIDGNMSNPLEMEGKNFDFTLHASGEHAILGDINEKPNPLVHNGIIPEGGTYISGIKLAYDYINGTYLDKSNAVYYNAGQPFPETVEEVAIYQFGDYEYTYYNSDNGWNVKVLDNSKESYGKILNTINGSDIVSMSSTFYGCRSLVTAPEIPDTVTSMKLTFYDCTSLVNAPEIPDSVTDMSNTFMDCISLVNVPEIPSSVTSMHGTFGGCTSLVNAPEIPDSVTNMFGTFNSCKSLVKAPVIPKLVTDMEGTFSGCTSLTGTVSIRSEQVTTIYGIFGNTVLPITVEVPEGSVTYSNLTSTESWFKLPDNVTVTTFVKE